MRRIKLIVEYDGRRYRGWQVQPNGPTIQAELETALLKLTGTHVRIRGAGRTDAGVHARGQVAAFDTESAIPIEQFARAMNSRLPGDIAVRHAAEALPDFDPRRACVRKQYAYSFVAGPIRPALDAGRVWHLPWPIDPEAMRTAAGRFVGRHSFHAFCRREADRPVDTVRDVERCALSVVAEPPPAEGNWTRPAWRMRLEVEGRSFLYNMVRVMAAALVEIGRGQLAAEHLEALFNPANPVRLPHCAPPDGLCLEWIRYAKEGA